MKQRNYILDLFRICAVLLVLMVHSRGYLGEKSNIINFMMGLGAYGVALYFVISGYFSAKSFRSKIKLLEYYKNRCIRILPMYYFSLFLTFIVMCYVTKTAYPSWEWLNHILCLGMFIPTEDFTWKNSVNYFWTIPSFMAWYFISPILLKRINSAKRALLYLCIGLIISRISVLIQSNFACERFVNWNFFTLVYTFLFGVLVFYLIDERRDNFIGGGYIVIALIIGALLGIRSGFLIFSTIFSLLLLFFVRFNCCVGNILMQKMLVYLSNISYSVYLMHWFVLTLFGENFEGLPWYLGFSIFGLCSIILGSLCHFCIEKPITGILSGHKVRFYRRK